MQTSIMTLPTLPFKSVGVALIYTVILGPLGLLYSSYRGGIFMLLIGLVVICSKLMFPIILVWVISCIWAVKAVEKYNKSILDALRPVMSQ